MRNLIIKKAFTTSPQPLSLSRRGALKVLSKALSAPGCRRDLGWGLNTRKKLNSPHSCTILAPLPLEGAPKSVFPEGGEGHNSNCQKTSRFCNIINSLNIFRKPAKPETNRTNGSLSGVEAPHFWNKYGIILLVFSLILFSCRETHSPTETDPPPVITPGETFLVVLNEGIYGQNNSSVTTYAPLSETAEQHAYSNANSGARLGDTANDMVLRDGKIYIAVDVSNKIEVIDSATLVSEGFIDLGADSSPREICFTPDGYGYVTSLYRNAVIKFDPESKTVLTEISVGQLPEGIVYSEGKVYVANSGFSGSDSVSVIDTEFDQVIKNIQTDFNPRNVFTDINGFIYVVCTGKYQGLGLGSLWKIDPADNSKIDSLVIYGNPGEAAILDNEFILVVNIDGILKVRINDLAAGYEKLVDSAIINPTGIIIYSIMTYPNHDYFYAGNPKDYVQNGEIVAFDKSGEEIYRFDCGLNPGKILLLERGE